MATGTAAAMDTDIDPRIAMATLIDPGMPMRATMVRASMPTVGGAGAEVGVEVGEGGAGRALTVSRANCPGLLAPAQEGLVWIDALRRGAVAYT
jgi:hypothetical protein